jgi:hypothetical protein
LIFEITALTHNLSIWHQVALLSQRTCRAFGKELLHEDNPVIVKELPNTLNGVFFLHNGFRDCVAINSGHEHQIIVDDPPALESSTTRAFRWNAATQCLDENR